MTELAPIARLCSDPDRLAAVVGGRWLRRPEPGARVTGASIDTRELRSGQVFFALRGSRVDGHDFLDDAAQRGASVAVVERDRISVPRGIAALRVESCERSMFAMARAVRERMVGVRVVGITGSVGKTTTVRLVEAACSGALRVHASIKSHNNRLGVSLTLLNTPGNAEVIVAEVGTSAPGEIAELAAVVRPDLAIITAIGRAHLEKLGSVEGVAREKASLLDGLTRQGVGIVPGVCAVLEPFLPAGRRIHRVALHEPARCDRGTTGMGVEVVAAGSTRVEFDMDGPDPYPRTRFSVSLGGRHSASNAAMAVAAARLLGVSDAHIAAGLERVQAPPLRARVERLELQGENESVTILNDAYNANPESMLAALDMLAELAPEPGARRVAILGDMLELGQASGECHAQVAARSCELGVDLVVAVGHCMCDAFQEIAASARETSQPEVVSESRLSDGAIARVVSQITPGDTVLLKGSRAMGLERVAEALRARAGVRMAGSPRAGR